jgi:hypothetical protein
MNGFIQLHQLCSHVLVDYILESMAWIFGAIQLLTLAKPFGGIRPIIIGKTFY